MISEMMILKPNNSDAKQNDQIVSNLAAGGAGEILVRKRSVGQGGNTWRNFICNLFNDNICSDELEKLCEPKGSHLEKTMSARSSCLRIGVLFQVKGL